MNLEDTDLDQLDNIAWKMYCDASAGAMSAVDFWNQLGPITQDEYRERAKNESLRVIAEHWRLTVDELKLKIQRNSPFCADLFIIEFLNACEFDPKKAACHVCGELNVYCDDAGYWCNYFQGKKQIGNGNVMVTIAKAVDPSIEYKAYCEKCDQGMTIPGDR